MKLVYIEADDWQYYGSEEKVNTDFRLAPLRLCGFLISRDKNTTVISMQHYPRYDEVRHTSVISNHSITKLVYLKGAKNELSRRNKKVHNKRNRKRH